MYWCVWTTPTREVKKTSRHPGESRDPALASIAKKLDSGFRRNDEQGCN